MLGGVRSWCSRAEAISWAMWRPSWPSKYCWVRKWWWWCAVRASAFLEISIEKRWNIWPSSASGWTPTHSEVPSTSGPEPRLLADGARRAAPQNQVGPGCHGPPRGVYWDLAPPWQEKANGGSCSPQGCAPEAYMEVCLSRAPGSWDWPKVPASYGHSGGKEEEGQDPLPQEKAAHEATETGWKERGQENWQITQRSSRPMDSWSEPNKIGA